MAKRVLSPAARRAISRAAKRRWAAYRAVKGIGGRRAGRKPGPAAGSAWSPARRARHAMKIRAALARRRRGGRGPGRPRGRPARGFSELAGMATSELIAQRRRIDQELADRLVRGQQ